MILKDANLRGTDLGWADLSAADLNRTNLIRTNLSAANLTEANFSGANLSEANLSEANLSEALLLGSDLNKANFGDNVKELMPSQIRTAKNWENAYFSKGVLENLGLPPDHNEKLRKEIEDNKAKE